MKKSKIKFNKIMDINNMVMIDLINNTSNRLNTHNNKYKAITLNLSYLDLKVNKIIK